jgi:hypothetical protein
VRLLLARHKIKLGRFEMATILASYKDIFVQCGRWIELDRWIGFVAKLG